MKTSQMYGSCCSAPIEEVRFVRMEKGMPIADAEKACNEAIKEGFEMSPAVGVLEAGDVIVLMRYAPLPEEAGPGDGGHLLPM